MDGYVLVISVALRLPTLPQLDGTAVECVATDLLEGLPTGEERPEQEQIAKGCVAAAYMGPCIRFSF
jgi:hypothetical protein